MDDLIRYIESKGYYVRYTSDPHIVQEGCREIRIIKYLYRDNPLRSRVFQHNWVFCNPDCLKSTSALIQIADNYMYSLEQLITQYRLIESTY